MNDVERIARMMCGSRGIDPDGTSSTTPAPPGLKPVPNWYIYSLQVREVLDKLREPSERMIAKANERVYGHEKGYDMRLPIKLRWKDMVDAALRDEPTEGEK